MFREGIHHNLEKVITELLTLVGEDPTRHGLKDTPKRVANMYQEILSGYAENPHQVVGNALFPVSTSQVVTIKEIQFCSTCEHHLLPFFGTVNIAYIPDKHVIGLSKLPRLVKIFSNRLQLQERLGEELSSAIDEILQPKGLLCEIRAMHLCVKMRGIKSTSSEMVTRVAKGEFATNPLARQEARELWR